MDDFERSIDSIGEISVNCAFSRPRANSVPVFRPSVRDIEDSAAILISKPNLDLDPVLTRDQVVIQAILQSLTEGVLVVNDWGLIVEINEAAAKLVQVSRMKLLGAKVHDFFHFFDEKNGESLMNPIQAAIAHQQEFKSRLSATLVVPNGAEVLVKITVSPVPSHGSGGTETVIILDDVTKSRILSQQLHWQSNHDPITGLVNRIYFEDMIAQALAQSRHTHQSFVLAHIDIDNFKVINDTCGNIAGDQLLGQLAIELQEKIRSVDSLARLGGDEFGILFHQCSLDEAYGIVTQLQADLEDFRYVWQGKSMDVAVSIGLVRLDEDTADVEIALSKADTACYTAKNRGKSRIQVFSSRDVAMEDLKRHQEWNFLIREALDDDRFYLYRQPIMGIDQLDDFPHHYEVLLRMVNSEGAIISPNRFIPTAERYQLMPTLDRWVIGHCLSRLEILAGEQIKSSISNANYAINLSGASLSDENFLAELIDSIAQTNMSYTNLCFEITETAAITNLKQVNRFMTALKQMGCRFSLDDFGAGMSSFGYLSTLPVDFVKIDGKFIQDLEADPSNATIVESIVHVSKSLGLMTIAERVEEKETAYRLKEMGVDFIQGFGVGRPHRWI